MKKNLIIVIVVVVIAVIVGVIALGAFKKPKVYATLDACKLFTEAEAKELLGPTATKKQENPTSTKHIKETACSYGNNAEAVRDLRVATVTVRSALTEYGLETTDDVFDAAQRPPAAQTISGYGKDAYYNPATGQLQILTDSSWITVTNGPIPIDRRTLEDTKKVADKLFNE